MKNLWDAITEDKLNFAVREKFIGKYVGSIKQFKSEDGRWEIIDRIKSEGENSKRRFGVKDDGVSVAGFPTKEEAIKWANFAAIQEVRK